MMKTRSERWRRQSQRLGRALTYLTVRAPLPSVVAGAVAAGTLRGWPSLLSTGVPTLLLGVAVLVLFAPRQRQAVTLLGFAAVADPHRESDQGGAGSALLLRLRERSTAREVLYAVVVIALAPLEVILLFCWLIALLLIFTPLPVLSGHPLSVGPLIMSTPLQAAAGTAAGLLASGAGAVAIIWLAGVHAQLVRVLLGPRGEELREQVNDLTRSRLRLVNAFDVERRRIERDLHDGAQQQLISLVMTLDLARIELEDAPQREAAALIEKAHAQATQTISDLRSLIQGIHPPVLSELGLPAALQTLTDRSPLPVDLQLDLPSNLPSDMERRPGEELRSVVRLPASVESAAYFIAAEALANAAKHSGAERVRVTLKVTSAAAAAAPAVAATTAAAPALLILQVSDNGHGGADATKGSGLTGLGDRVAAVGGRLNLTSPRGGPTVLQAEIPLPASRDRD